MTFMDYVGPFLLLLLILIVVHELGHFLVAKWFGVKVERFSVGFGPSLFRRQVGETEYVLAWLPLGGYVKMLGESPDEELPPEDAARSFNGQSPWRRIGIALAGPGMNLLLSVLVIAGVYMTGWPTLTSRIGSVEPGTPAAEAGLRPGDRVIEVDGQPIWRWQDLQEAVQAGAGGRLQFAVERGDERVETTVEPRSVDGAQRIGVAPATARAVIGVPDPAAAAGQAGLRTGDRVVSLNGEPVLDWYQFVATLEAATGPLALEIARPVGEDEEQTRSVSLPAGPGRWSLEQLGAIRVDFAVIQLIPGKPAKRAGFEPGDIFLRVNGEPVTSFEKFALSVRDGGGAPLSVVVLRDGGEVALDVVPSPETANIDGELRTVHRIGLSGGPPALPGEMIDETVWNPLRALWLGTTRTAAIAGAIVDGVRMLITREVGVDNLAGPIGIGELAGDTFAEESWFPFLWMMCFISVNLAILNLLPIPVLDGGHIVFALTEAARGSPVGARAREIAQTVGITLVLFLIGFAFWNDISRNWAGIVGFLKKLI